MDTEELYEHPESLEEKPPAFLVNIWDQVTVFTTDYGWFILGVALVVIYFWNTIQEYLEKWYKEKSDREYDAKCKKDPDWIHTRQQEMEAARKRMQDELNAKAELHTAKMKEKEEMKRAQLLEASGIDGGQRLGTSNGTSRNTASNSTGSTSSIKKNYRPEYNPLMGNGGSGGYRPPRRGCPGGGCG